MKYPGKVKAPKAAKKPERVDPNNHDWPMTDEDRSMIREGQAYGQEHARAYVDAAKGEMLRLISTYSDAEAEALFWSLRERFWARLWTPPGVPPIGVDTDNAR